MNYKVLSRLYAVCRDVGIDDETLHERVKSEFGIDSLKKLSDRQGYYLVDVLQGKRARKPLPPGAVHRTQVSEGQIWKIHELERELGWENEPQRLAGFIKKYAGVDKEEWLTRRAAGAVIEGLKGMVDKL